jgi:hypothetical protein
VANVSELIGTIGGEEPKFIEKFSLNNIRVNTLDADSEPVARRLSKKSQPIPSVRATILLFLAVNYTYERPMRIVLVSPQSASIVESLGAFMRSFYPRATIAMYPENKADHLYENINEIRGDGADETVETYLVSLVTNVQRHRDLVQYFCPDHALMALEFIHPVSFQFYSGELWIPPFVNKTLYVRSKPEATLDPLSEGPIYDGIVITNALRKFKTFTNEDIVYLNPETGSDTYLFGKFPNDYSHLFIYFAVGKYLTKLKQFSEIAKIRSFDRILGSERKNFVYQGNVIYGAGILLKNGSDYLIVDDADPGGRVSDKDQNIFATAVREFTEKLGISVPPGLKYTEHYVARAKYMIYLADWHGKEIGSGSWVSRDELLKTSNPRIATII